MLKTNPANTQASLTCTHSGTHRRVFPAVPGDRSPVSRIKQSAPHYRFFLCPKDVTASPTSSKRCCHHQGGHQSFAGCHYAQPSVSFTASWQTLAPDTCASQVSLWCFSHCQPVPEIYQKLQQSSSGNSFTMYFG
jgi:hypothetical protein